MRKVIIAAAIIFLNSCSNGVYIPENQASEYENGVRYCAFMKEYDKEMCLFHWQVAYAKKYHNELAGFTY